MFHRDVTGSQADTSREGEHTALFSRPPSAQSAGTPGVLLQPQRAQRTGCKRQGERKNNALHSHLNHSASLPRQFFKKWCKISIEQHPSLNICLPKCLPRTSKILPELMYFSLESLSRAVSSLRAISDIFTFSFLCFNDGKCLFFLTPLFTMQLSSVTHSLCPKR